MSANKLEYRESTWCGFRRLDFEFEGYPAILVMPDVPHKARRLAIKMEYFDAFPATEIAMLKAGYHLAHIKNRSRFATDDDMDRKARLIAFLADEFGTAKRIVTVGMSCGGFQSICFASRYPEMVSFLYLDAPLLTFFSVGTKLFDSMVMGKRWPEIRAAYGFKTFAEAYCYPDQPANRLPLLAKARLPIGLVYGAQDEAAPPVFNAEIVRELYEAEGAPIRTWCRPLYGHHPHGLEDPTELLSYIEEVAL